MDKLSIGIVTYSERFDSYFKPLIRKLCHLFPDIDINVFINGHYDIVKQVRYLRAVTAFLGRYPNIRYVTNVEHQSLARGWNWLILMSRFENVLILNDDVLVDWEFRWHLERLEEVPSIFTLNGSWSHFVINKEIVKAVGWFDERFLGVGDEDGDYMCRLAMQGITLRDIAVHGLHNYVAPSEDASWAKISGVIDQKYSQVNREFFMKKWWRSDYAPVPSEGSFKVRHHGSEWDVALNTEMEAMPEYYPLDCLQAPENDIRGRGHSPAAIIAQACSFGDHLFQSSKRALRAFYQRGWQQLRGNKGQH